MKKYSFYPLFIAVGLFLVFLFLPKSWLENAISDHKAKLAATELNPLMFQGDYMQRKILSDPTYFPIYGSSELSRFDPFHPSNYFAANQEGFTPFLYGRGGTQSLIQFMNLAAHADQLKGKKMVIILSPQWFHKEGIGEGHFSSNYSMLQGYGLAFNHTIKPELKKEAIRRLLQFDVIKRDTVLTALYRDEIAPSKYNHLKAEAVRPIALMKKKLLEKKDRYYTLLGGKQRHRHDNPDLVKDKSWAQLEHEAEKYAKKRANNNPYLIDNRYYKRKIAPMEKKLRNYKKDTSFVESVEYNDFQMLLDLLKDAKAEPLFISIPVNGRWYDYTGFPKGDRNQYYKKIKRQVETAGFPIADFSDHEYDPYFTKDTMHIAWKGWVYLDKEMEKYWKQ
ncbi:D-alanyl-lipoteichoic acid biosynthesis protein DltD [Lederbergia sp. NSJ-179]|uniref:D-alanyl-lipoteichoic acid biosynthesis protein DltD n=1 Tax=Lederbergia sp. NSJ-179 TaxID=2931402 RepID=UPI001FD5F3D6|nr:D-alanyl-lipoteichoic acid biosynthesis protein DltD [Lederbergia sp. NSJ-179]MCJ7841568.1 D-alanyl-lipoteichoic acid biosynthesis protein DltD [Lederbergia sp. NSJ-179]